MGGCTRLLAGGALVLHADPQLVHLKKASELGGMGTLWLNSRPHLRKVLKDEIHRVL